MNRSRTSVRSLPTLFSKEDFSKIFLVNAYICVAFYQTYDRLYDVMKRV